MLSDRWLWRCRWLLLRRSLMGQAAATAGQRRAAPRADPSDSSVSWCSQAYHTNSLFLMWRWQRCRNPSTGRSGLPRTARSKRPQRLRWPTCRPAPSSHPLRGDTRHSSQSPAKRPQPTATGTPRAVVSLAANGREIEMGPKSVLSSPSPFVQCVRCGGGGATAAVTHNSAHDDAATFAINAPAV